MLRSCAFGVDDLPGIRNTLAALKAAAERLIGAARALGAVARGVPNVFLTNCVAHANNHDESSANANRSLL